MTSPTDLRFGFRVLGDATNERRLIVHQDAFNAYCECDERAEVTAESYLSAFTFGNDFRDYLAENRTVKGFNGICWSAYLWFDVDRDDLATAQADTRRLVGYLADQFKLDDDDLLIFFSGSKGFHVGLPVSLWMPEPSTMFHRYLRRMAEGLGEAAGMTIDTGVYDKVRLFRAPNSRHGKTGLHKRRLSFDELMGLSIEAVVSMAAEPSPFETCDTTFVTDVGAKLWQAAVAAVDQQTAAATKRKATGTAKLNRLTMDFIRDGAASGDRHRLLFSAAANLAEFNCPPQLAHALLTEPALDCGLSPSDVSRTIDCGLEVMT